MCVFSNEDLGLWGILTENHSPDQKWRKKWWAQIFAHDCSFLRPVFPLSHVVSPQYEAVGSTGGRAAHRTPRGSGSASDR